LSVFAIRDLLHDAADRLGEAGVEGGRLDARILLAHAMQISREQLIAADRQPSAEQASAFLAMVDRRVAREPLAYITRHKEFWSLDFKVGPGALIPRPDTETLIEAAVALFPDRSAPLAIADLGTGSGALLIAALKEFTQAHGFGFERSPDALGYALANLDAHGLGSRAEILAADWNAAPASGFDLILSNPPYIPTREIDTLDPEVRLHEPRAALDGGPDGLDSYRSLARLLPRLLRPGASALLELGQGQFAAVEPLFQDLQTHPPVRDLAGIPRVLVLKRPK
jgi:release factor glutamine methyltransferase